LLVQSSAWPRAVRRGPGRPVGADSAATRARILRAAREVINERGYQAATFQAIAARAGLSRPAMHYYFHTREQIYENLVQEAYSIVTDCIAQARREDSLLKQLSTFVAAAQRLDLADGSMMRFIITSRLEFHRHPNVGAANPTAAAVHGFYTSMVDEAIQRREIPDDADAAAMVNLLFAMFWGMGFYASFLDEAGNIAAIAKQLHQLFVHGLLARALPSSTSPSFGRPGSDIDVPAVQPPIAG
jgi:AcrR family transcriptional regulator